MIKLAKLGLVFTISFTVLTVIQLTFSNQQFSTFKLQNTINYLGLICWYGMYIFLGILLVKLHINIVTVIACWASTIIMFLHQIISFVSPINTSYIMLSSLVIFIPNLTFNVGLFLIKNHSLGINFKWLSVTFILKVLAGAIFPAVFAATGMRWVLYLADLFFLFLCIAFYFFLERF